MLHRVTLTVILILLVASSGSHTAGQDLPDEAASAAAVQPVANGLLTDDEIKNLVSASPKLYGWVGKQDVPDFRLDSMVMGEPAEGTWQTAWQDWVVGHALGRENGGTGTLTLGTVAPPSGNCMYLFNPHYKFIYMRNTRIAGASIFAHFGGICSSADLTLSSDNKNCLWTPEAMVAVGLPALGYPDWEDLWRHYTVFSAVRNPFDRAAAAYKSCKGRRAEQAEHSFCRIPTFKHFCQRPYVLGLQALFFKCGVGKEQGGVVQVHDFSMVETQSRCIFNKEGRRVFDWLIRVDKLDADSEGLLQRLNTFRDNNLPRLSTKLQQVGKLNQAAHLDEYLTCRDDCIAGIARYYASDFALLRYPQSAANLTSAGQ